MKFNQVYLGVKDVSDSELTVCVSEQRNLPLNKHWYYRIVIAQCGGQRIISVSDSIEQEIVDQIVTYNKGKR